MSIDETDLLAYADGHLPPERRAEVETAIACNAELAAQLTAMRASVLPYGAAYDAQPLPPVPAVLRERITELLEAESHRRQQDRAPWPRLAAAFAAGAACCAIGWTLLSGTPASMYAAARTPPWIQAVADYQQLYSRETLTNVTEDHQLTERVIGELRLADAMNVRVPDLRSAGLDFKRVQRLRFHDQPVVQMVYLPERGDPVAVCVTREARADEDPHAWQIDGLTTVAWRRDNLGYVMLGRSSPQSLLELAQRVASAKTASLYGRVVDDATGGTT